MFDHKGNQPNSKMSANYWGPSGWKAWANSHYLIQTYFCVIESDVRLLLPESDWEKTWPIRILSENKRTTTLNRFYEEKVGDKEESYILVATPVIPTNEPVMYMASFVLKAFFWLLWKEWIAERARMKSGDSKSEVALIFQLRGNYRNGNTERWGQSNMH